MKEKLSSLSFQKGVPSQKGVCFSPRTCISYPNQVPTKKVLAESSSHLERMGILVII